MSDLENDEDNIQINTSNQTEQDRKLAKKKKFLADKKKDQTKKVLKRPREDGSIDKNSKLKNFDKKVMRYGFHFLFKNSYEITFHLQSLEIKLKKAKTSIVNAKADEESENKDVINIEKDIDTHSGRKSSNKFEKKRQHLNTQLSSGTSKMAKFSSLFKNNHEIPRVGELVFIF